MAEPSLGSQSWATGAGGSGSDAMIERRDGEVIEYGMSEWSDVTTCDDDLQILYITILY